jgi:hypothetical protein
MPSPAGYDITVGGKGTVDGVAGMIEVSRIEVTPMVVGGHTEVTGGHTDEGSCSVPAALLTQAACEMLIPLVPQA